MEFVSQKWQHMKAQQREKVIVDLAAFVRRLHDARISLPDLYIWHIFISEGRKPGTWDFAVIDLHRMARLPYHPRGIRSCIKFLILSAGLLHQLDYFIEVVGRFDGRVTEPALLFFVVVDRYVGIFQWVACQHAGNSLVGSDYAFSPEVP